MMLKSKKVATQYNIVLYNILYEAKLSAVCLFMSIVTIPSISEQLQRTMTSMARPTFQLQDHHNESGCWQDVVELAA